MQASGYLAELLNSSKKAPRARNREAKDQVLGCAVNKSDLNKIIGDGYRHFFVDSTRAHACHLLTPPKGDSRVEHSISSRVEQNKPKSHAV